MEFIVMKVQDLRMLPGNLGNSFTLPMKDRPGLIFQDEGSACLYAQTKAEENPGELYTVLKPIVVYEAKKPEKIDVVVKEYTASGELVPMKV